MRTIGMVMPTTWDRGQLAACRSGWADRFAVVEIGPKDSEVPWDFDVFGFLRATVAERQGTLHGLFSSSDYPGAPLCAALAQQLGLPGAPPAAVLGAANKFHARTVQRQVAKVATPAFALVDPEQPPAELPFPGPVFVKPNKGVFSKHARIVRDIAELHAFLRAPALLQHRQRYLRMFCELQAHYAPHLPPADHVLVEELLAGQLLTVEGFVADGAVQILGVVDAALDPGSGSFARFDYPSALPLPLQARIAEVAAAVALGLGLQSTFFNIEMFADAESGRIAIVEVNPRMCGQFADLYEKVDGVNSYLLALHVAAGERPAVARRGGRFAAAASVPLRVFAPVRVQRAPTAEQVAAVEQAFPGLLAWNECQNGEELWDFANEDGHSIRYGVLNAGGRDRSEAGAIAARAADLLGYEFTALPRC